MRWARRHPERICRTTLAEKKQGDRETAWRRLSLPGCLHLPLSHSEVANCGNSSQPCRAGPGAWPAWFYGASPSQSGSKELGQLSNFAKAAPFFIPRCYNKYMCLKRKKSKCAVRGTRWLQTQHRRGILRRVLGRLCGAPSCVGCCREMHILSASAC